jgi:hypothetical protein
MGSRDIAEYVRTYYTDQGVEVEGTGSGRMRLRMPPEFHNVTEMCRDLVQNYDAVVDLVIDEQGGQKSCVIFEVYCEHRQIRQLRRLGDSEADDTDTDGDTSNATKESAAAPATHALPARTPYMVYILPVFVTVAFHCVIEHVWKPAMAAKQASA